MRYSVEIWNLATGRIYPTRYLYRYRNIKYSLPRIPIMLATLLAFCLSLSTTEASSPLISYMRDGEVRLTSIDGKTDLSLVNTDYDRPTWWYPDGSRLIYRHDSSEEGWNMFSIDVQTKETKALTKGRTHDNRSASFSPDGKRIAYVSGKSGLCVMDSEGRQITALNSKQPDRDIQPSWSSDSKNLFYESVEEPVGLYALELATGRSSFISKGMLHQLTPDRKSVFLIRHSLSGAELWERDLRSTKETKWLESAWKPWTYATSPTGKVVAFYGPPKSPGLFICSDPKTSPKKIANAHSDCLQSLQFSPDGKLIAYTSGERNHEEIWITSVDGKMSKRLVRGSWPSWQPVRYSRSKMQ